MEWYINMIERAKEFIKNGQSLSPMMMMLKQENISIIDLSPVQNDKDFMSFLMKELVHKHNPDEYLVLMESWIKIFDIEDKGLSKLVFNGTIQVSQLPSAQDCITIVYGNRDGEKMGMITFKNKGKNAKFNPIQWMGGQDGIKAGGRFVGLR